MLEVLEKFLFEDLIFFLYLLKKLLLELILFVNSFALLWKLVKLRPTLKIVSKVINLRIFQIRFLINYFNNHVAEISNVIKNGPY